MEDYPRTALEFEGRFSSEEACRECLVQLRWPSGFVCPRCNGTHQGAVESSHLDYYLDEYTFRFNRRTSVSRGKLFYRLVQQAVNVTPVTDKEIRAVRKPIQYEGNTTSSNN